MIYDSVSNISRYYGIDGALDLALSCIEKSDLREAAVGRHDIQGDTVYCNVSDAAYVEQGKWEAHRVYADVQLNLDGGEVCLCATQGAVDGWTPYDAEKDIAFSTENANGVALPLEPGMFAILFPNEPHMPCLKQGGRDSGRKVVFKVKMG